MKRRDIIRELAATGWALLRHGGRHDIYACHAGTHKTPVPRHGEISNGVRDNIRARIEQCKSEH